MTYAYKLVGKREIRTVKVSPKGDGAMLKIIDRHGADVRIEWIEQRKA